MFQAGCGTHHLPLLNEVRSAIGRNVAVGTVYMGRTCLDIIPLNETTRLCCTSAGVIVKQDIFRHRLITKLTQQLKDISQEGSRISASDDQGECTYM